MDEINEIEITKKEKAKAYSKEYYQNNRIKIKRKALSKVYEKLGTDIPTKKKIWRKQGKICVICKKPIQLYHSHLDHCHITGAIRGVLCHKCNTGIGLLGDNRERCIDAALYLSTYNQFDILTRVPKVVS